MADDHNAPATPDPAHLDALRDAFAATAPEPAVGQIWRARWRHTAQLVLVLRTDDVSVSAAPITPDVELGDDLAVIVDDDASPFGYAVLVWTGLTADLPVRVLDVDLGDIDRAALAAVEGRRGIGAPITHPLDERAQVRDAISDRMEALANAVWAPEAATTIDLTAAMKAKGFTPGKLAPIIGVDAGEIMAVARGDTVPTPELAERLGPLLGIEPLDLLGARRLDPDLVWAFDRPSLRRPLRERAEAEGFEDEGAFRYHVATAELALAARQTKSTSPRDRYLGLIRDYLDAR